MVKVEDFGYWRMFLLYTGYVGFIHLGSLEGAFLAWAGKPLVAFSNELLPVLKFLTVEHLAILLPGCVVAAIFLPAHARFLVISIALYGVLLNLATAFTCALQAARWFGPAAISSAAPTALFLAMVLASGLFMRADFRILIFYYSLSCLGMLAYLWWIVHPSGSEQVASAWDIGKKYVLMGWPITLSSTALIMAQSADRVVLTSAVSIYDFAQYSLAASTIMAPLAIIAALARVFFPHLAGARKEQHAEIYRQVSRLIVLAWCLMLPYYFAVESFVHHFLPAYIPGLPYARVLLLGVLFFAYVQILHNSIFNLHGKQKRFLLYALAALGLGLSLTAIAARIFHSLMLVAEMQVLAIGLLWLFIWHRVRSFTDETWLDVARVMTLFAWGAASLWIARSWAENWVMASLCYWMLVAVPLVWSSSQEMRLVLHLVRGSVHRSRSRLAVFRGPVLD
jgi:O-antigen/teichoic acid export membrane protein